MILIERTDRDMGDYYCTRLWQVKTGMAAAEVEELAGSGIVEMQRWIPGVKRLSLLRLVGEPQRYLMVLNFASYESYAYWRQVEEEAPDYWERFAAVLMQWGQLCDLVEEYTGEQILDVGLDRELRV